MRALGFVVGLLREESERIWARVGGQRASAIARPGESERIWHWQGHKRKKRKPSRWRDRGDKLARVRKVV